MTYGKGLKPSTPHRIAHRLGAAHVLGLAGTPKGSAQLQACPRLDQGGSGTCHSHSAVGAIWTALMAAGKRPAWVGSPLTLASCTYADVRALQYPAGPLPPLVDTGAELQDDADALSRWGLAPMGNQIAGRGGISDVPDDVDGQPFHEPVRAQVELAGKELVSGEYSIAVDQSAPNTVALALDAGIPVWLGVFVDTAFERLGPTDIAQPGDQSDPNGGGHALYISGYRTESGILQFRVENSWGSSWADNGAVWASEAWLLSCWNLWPMKVAS